MQGYQNLESMPEIMPSNSIGNIFFDYGYIAKISDGVA